MPLSIRTWLRYVVPLTVLGAIACAPLVLVALRVSLPADATVARVAIRTGWALAAAAFACELLVVAAVAPAVEAARAGAPLTQLEALTRGARTMVRGIAPWLVGLLAIVLGGIALVIPGAVLAVLVSLTGASPEIARGPRAALADSIARVRTQLRPIATIVAAVVAAHLAVAAGLQVALVPTLAKKMPAGALVPVVVFVRSVALSVVVLAPLAACLLATRYSHSERS